MNNKISKFSAYILLLGYLTITITYVFHHHNVDLGKASSSLSSTENEQNNNIDLLGSEVLCVVQFAYNSLHNSLVSVDNPTQDYQTKPEFITQTSVSTKPTKESIFSFCLRAPPLSIS